MSERQVYHVSPAREAGDWEVKEEGAARARSRHQSKQEAVTEARRLARSRPLGRIVIHNSDGTIQEERTYGKDPHPPQG